MSQPPLSRQIQLLEKAVGADLFERTTRRVELTPAGRLLYPAAERLIGDADGIDRLMAEYRAGESGLLRLGFVDSASYDVMPRFLRSYRERWPGVQFGLYTMSSDAQRSALLAGELDVGIARTRGSEPGMVHTTLFEERLFVAVNSDHHLADSRSVKAEALRDETFIGFSRTESPALSEELRTLLDGEGVDYDPVFEAEEYTTIIGLVAAGQGVAIVPAAVRTFQPTNLHYIELSDVQATTRLMLVSRADEQLRVVSQALTLAAQLFASE